MPSALPSPAATMVDVDAALDAQLAAERRSPAVAEEGQRQRKISWNALAMLPEESAAISLRGVSCAEDMIKLVPSRIREGLESAKDLPPTSPQHGQSSSDDRGAHQVTAESSAAGGSDLLNSTMEHKKASDISTFPISCSLKKHAQGFYILSGACCLCGQTFRAVGSVC